MSFVDDVQGGGREHEEVDAGRVSGEGYKSEVGWSWTLLTLHDT